MASEVINPKGAYAGGKAIGKAQERRAVVAYLQRYAGALSIEKPCAGELANTLRTLAACIADGHHSENQ